MSVESLATNQERMLEVVYEVITSLNIDINNYMEADGSFNMGKFINTINGLDLNNGNLIEIKSTQPQ
jgi:hypothetical protein